MAASARAMTGAGRGRGTATPNEVDWSKARQHGGDGRDSGVTGRPAPWSCERLSSPSRICGMPLW